MDPNDEDKPYVILKDKSQIGRIAHVDYIGRSVAVVMPPKWISGPTRVQVIASIDLGTPSAPRVTQGQTIRIIEKPDNTYLGIQIDPPETDCVTKLSDLIDFALTVSGVHETHDIWWRGQERVHDSEGPWTLVPGVYRKGRTHVAEISNVSRFMAKARSRHSDCPPDDRFVDWLFLMQHYGLPTRLLDWSESPLVAAFFAVKGEPEVKNEPEPDGAIWALNPTKLNLPQIGRPVVLGAMSREAIPLFKQAFERDAPQPDKILGIAAPEIDARMLAQMSTFTLHGSSIPLEKFQDKTSQLFLHKAIIPGTAKKLLRVELERLGIRLDNLFPDLEHLAQVLKDKEYWS